MATRIQSFREQSGEEVLELRKEKLFTDVYLLFCSLLLHNSSTLNLFFYKGEIKLLLDKRDSYYNLFIKKTCPLTVILNWIEYEQQFLKLLKIRRLNKGFRSIPFIC